MSAGRPKGATTHDQARIVRLHESGVPSSVIARRVGCPRGEVDRVVREHVLAAGRDVVS